MQTTCLLRYFQTTVKDFGQQETVREETVREETRTAKAAVRATDSRHLITPVSQGCARPAPARLTPFLCL